MLLAVSLMISLFGCGGASELGANVEVPHNEFVKLDEEVWSEVQTAQQTANSTEDPLQRAEAYLFIADTNLFIWDELYRRSEELDETQGKLYAQMVATGRIHFLQAHRARALSWAERAKNSPEYVPASAFEGRLAQAWAAFDRPAEAYNTLEALLGEVIEAKTHQYVDVDFLSDLRYGLAIFHTLLDRPAADMSGFMKACGGNEAEAVRLAGDVAFLYDRLVGKPDTAADTYRVIAATKPQTREGYEAQVSVLESLRKKQRVGAMKVGNTDSFDTSSEGMEVFREVNRDISNLVKISENKEKWITSEADDSNLEARAEELVRNFTVRMHGLAQQQNSPAFYELAVNAYVNYHAMFPTGGYVYDMLFFHAEALFQLGRYDLAYEQYRNALGTNPQGKFREQIVRSLVMTAYERCKQHPLPASPPETRAEMPEVHRDFISSGEQFITVLGDGDPEMAGYVTYEVILRHYLYGEFRVAEAPLENFVKFDNTHPQGRKAAVLWLDLLAREAARGSDREKRALERAVERVQSTSVLMEDEAVRQKLEEVTRKPPYISGRLP